MSSPALRASAFLDDSDFCGLPLEQRTRARDWIAALDAAAGLSTAQAKDQRLAQIMDCSVSTARRTRTSWVRTHDWRCLVDQRARASSAGKSPNQTPRFLAFWHQLCEKHQRCTRSAIREIHSLWFAGEPIPGYEDHHSRARLPPGLHERSLYRRQPEKRELAAARFGIKTARKSLPQGLRTRVGLHVGSHIQFDDVWHDHYVCFGNHVTRVLEFGAHDVFSACRFAWGSKPRMPKDESGKHKEGVKSGHRGLLGREFRLFLAGVLWNHGYSALGTVLMMEHGTAALSDAVIALLHDRTCGKIEVSAGGLTGEEQSILGLWGGRVGGNPNTKAPIESSHSLIHNLLDFLPGQTGKDRQHLPEKTHGLVRYQEALLAWTQDFPAERRAAFENPLWDYTTEFLPFLDHVYRNIFNARTGHRLEGWAKCGHFTEEWNLDPSQNLWLPGSEIAEETRSLILAGGPDQIARYRRHRPLSPGEVFNRGKQHLQRIPLDLLADILGPDEAKPRKVRGAYFRFRDQNIDAWDELIYEACVTTPDGREQELRDGETYDTFANPYAPKDLLVLDAKGRILGVAQQAGRHSYADREGAERAWGRNAQRQANILDHQRRRWQPEVDAAQRLRQHNADLGFPGTNESGRARPRFDDGHREARTARAKRDRQAREATAEVLERDTRPSTPDDPHSLPWDNDPDHCPLPL